MPNQEETTAEQTASLKAEVATLRAAIAKTPLGERPSGPPSPPAVTVWSKQAALPPALTIKLASQNPELGVKTTKLSDIHGQDWRDYVNSYGERPHVNFAFCEPFQLMDSHSAGLVRACVERQYGTEHEYSTARTPCCIRACEELVGAMSAIPVRREIERIVSMLAGVPLRMHYIEFDRAHVNVQRTVQSKPVDDWHQDSTPFVLITVLTDHTDDTGGQVLVRRKGQNDAVDTVKCARPGSAIFMQGSHIWHCAQQSNKGYRQSMVTSFVAESPFVYDSTSLRASLMYSPPAACVEQFLKHALQRINHNAADLATKLRALNDERGSSVTIPGFEVKPNLAALRRRAEVVVGEVRKLCREPQTVVIPMLNGMQSSDVTTVKVISWFFMTIAMLEAALNYLPKQESAAGLLELTPSSDGHSVKKWHEFANQVKLNTTCALEMSSSSSYWAAQAGWGSTRSRL